jgi:hypothetical protein
MNEITKTKTIAENYDFKAVEGLHFNMSDEDYFAIPCLSASGLKMLKTNPSKFWWYSWMNPDKEDKSTEARVIGKAFHKRILEGKEAFYNEYAREFSCDRDDLITTGDDIKAILRKEKEANPDVKVTFKNKDEGIAYLLGLNPEYGNRVFDALKNDYEYAHGGKIFLPDWVIDRAELCAKVIENHPYLKTAFIGGYAEVSCVWFDKDLKEWCKCRYDYLKVSAINDLKTFTRMTDKEIERFLPDQITKYGYNIQATHYMDSLPYAKQFAKDGKVFDFVGDDAWLKAFASRPCDQFHFVFQQKEEIPNAYEVIFSKNHAMYEASQSMICHGVDEYKLYTDRYGDEMWAEIKQPQVLTDDDYPPWAY